MKNLVFFGDSHTARSGFFTLFTETNNHLAGRSGAGPYKIMEDVYDFLNDPDRPFHTEVKDTLLVIQYSYLSRLYLPIGENELRFDGNFHSPCDNYNKFGLDFNHQTLEGFYQYFIMNFYDEEVYLNKFIKDVEIFNSFIEKKGYRYINYLWDSTCVEETLLDKKDTILYDNLKNLNFVEFEPRQFLFGRIAEEKKLRICDSTDINDQHLSPYGYSVLKEYLQNEINIYKKKLI
jgi:hypothetical protein